MRRPRALWLLLPLLAVPLDLAGARSRVPGPTLLQEPTTSLRQTVLSGREGKAVVSSGGRTAKVPLRRGERLVEIAETAGGWVVAGVRRTERGTALVVVQDGSAGVERLASPARGGELHRAAPRVLVENGALSGVAWLEGKRPDRMAVRAAQWTGAGWTASATVAPMGEGSQTGLAQAVLADGSWLLVWSRYDGVDNELYWSRWSGNEWSPATAVESDDRVPDVTPTLIRTADGALVAWSEYDGRRYRLRLARFTGRGWSPIALSAGDDALYAKFRRGVGGTHLLYRTAQPAGWAFLEIGPEGRAGRLSTIETEDARRPVARSHGAAGVSFEWSDGRPRTERWRSPR